MKMVHLPDRIAIPVDTVFNNFRMYGELRDRTGGGGIRDPDLL